MPHNNRVSASSALKTNDIWSKTIGHDPYASKHEHDTTKATDNIDNLKLLVKISNVSGNETRGGCKKCGMLGHLTFQCRNLIPTGDNIVASDSEAESEGSSVKDVGVTNNNLTRKRSRESSKKNKEKKKRKKQSKSEKRRPG